MVITFIIDKEDQIQEVDADLWLHCMLNESVDPPCFLSADVENSLSFFLEHFLHIKQEDVTHRNCKMVYIKLIDEIRSLLI